MQSNANLTVWLIVWIVALLAILFTRWRRHAGGSGLLFAYLLNLWLIHWVAAFLYLLPYEYYDVSLVVTGFEQSAYGILAFALGNLVVAPLITPVAPFPRSRTGAYQPHPDLPLAYMFIGGVSYLLLSSVLGRLPSATALIAVGQYLFVVGLCLSCWNAWRRGSMRKLIAWASVALLLPFITILSRGFIGYGTIAASLVFAFVANLARPRWKVMAAGLLLGYLAFSFYVGYMRDRGEIREVVWGGQPLWARVERVYSTLRTVEWFDLSNENHLHAVDERLNQNFLVGTAIRRLSSAGDYAYGRTLWEGLLALIPRALWPEKPVFAGSPGLVTAYTGIPFAPGTSVGIGQVMEFYINFGTLGVIVGFLILGTLVTIVDGKAAQRLWQGDWQGFAVWYLMGISFLQVGGSIVEVTGTAGAGVATAVLVNKYVLSRYQKRRPPGTRARVGPAIPNGPAEPQPF